MNGTKTKKCGEIGKKRCGEEENDDCTLGKTLRIPCRRSQISSFTTTRSALLMWDIFSGQADLRQLQRFLALREPAYPALRP